MKSMTHTSRGIGLRALSAVLAALLLASMLSGCYLLPEEEATLEAPELTVKEVTYTTYAVERGDIERWETGTGYFASTVNENLMFGKAGTMKKLHVRSGDEVTAGQLIAELDTGNITEQIEYQEYVVEKARLSYLAQGGDSSSSYGAQMAKLDYEYQKKQLDKLYAQAENSELYAPMNGIITYSCALKAGDYVEEGRVVVTISDPTQLIISYQPENVEEIYTGMKMDLTMNNEEETYVGTVIQTPSDVPADASDADKANIYIQLDNTPDFATIGTKANISILLERCEDVIALPSKYLSKVSTRYYVRVLVDGLPEERDVTIGMTNGTLYEITSGLEVGEEIVA